MNNIRLIPLDELHNDLAAATMEKLAFEKLLVAAPAGKRGMMEQRINVNSQVVQVIDAELMRRRTAVLIGCSKRKLASEVAVPVSELYQGDLFRAQLAYARQVLRVDDQRIFVMSAEHGLVSLDALLQPYNVTLADMLPTERRQWGEWVAESLLAAAPDVERIFIMAGKLYRKVVMPRLDWLTIENPIPGSLGYGQQVAWLKAQGVIDGQA